MVVFKLKRRRSRSLDRRSPLPEENPTESPRPGTPTRGRPETPTRSRQELLDRPESRMSNYDTSPPIHRVSTVVKDSKGEAGTLSGKRVNIVNTREVYKQSRIPYSSTMYVQDTPGRDSDDLQDVVTIPIRGKKSPSVQKSYSADSIQKSYNAAEEKLIGGEEMHKLTPSAPASKITPSPPARCRIFIMKKSNKANNKADLPEPARSPSNLQSSLTERPRSRREEHPMERVKILMRQGPGSKIPLLNRQKTGGLTLQSISTNSSPHTSLTSLGKMANDNPNLDPNLKIGLLRRKSERKVKIGPEKVVQVSINQSNDADDEITINKVVQTAHTKQILPSAPRLIAVKQVCYSLTLSLL